MRPGRDRRRPGRGAGHRPRRRSAASTPCAAHTGAATPQGTVVVRTATCRCSPAHTLAALVADARGRRGGGHRAHRRRRRPDRLRPRRPRRGRRRAARSSSTRTPTARSARSSEINSGIYAFDGAGAARRRSAGSTPTTRRVRCTSPTSSASPATTGCTVQALPIEDTWQVEGVNDRVQLATLGAELNRRLLHGVDAGRGHRRRPGDDLGGRRRPSSRPTSRCCPASCCAPATTVAAGATVGPDTTLTGCEVGAGAEVVRSHGSGARIGAGASVGPFTLPAARAPSLGADGKIGAFVETKNARIGDGLEGAAPLLRRRRRRSARAANIGAATVFVELRRRREAPHDRRRPRADRQRHDARRAGHRGGRRLHRGRVRDHRGRPARRARRRAGQAARERGLDAAAPARARRPPRRRRRPKRRQDARTRPCDSRGAAVMTEITTRDHHHQREADGADLRSRAPGPRHRGRVGARRRHGADDGATTSRTARSTSGSARASAAATRSSSRATARRSTSGSWSSCSWSTRSSAPRPSASR